MRHVQSQSQREEPALCTHLVLILSSHSPTSENLLLESCEKHTVQSSWSVSSVNVTFSQLGSFMVLLRQMALCCPSVFFKAVRVLGQLPVGCNKVGPIIQVGNLKCFGPSPTFDKAKHQNMC